MWFSLGFINKLYKTGLLLVILLFVTDLLAFFYYPETTFADIFLATREQTPLTWLSSLTFLFIALSCFSTYLQTNGKLWYFLSVIFFFFSMDDAVYFHERLSGFLVDNTTVFDFFPSYVWVMLYFPLLAFSLGSLLYLLWIKHSKAHNQKLMLAALFLGIAIFLDLLDGFIQKNPSIVFCFSEGCNASITHLIRLGEEILEVLSLGFLGYLTMNLYCTKNNK